MSAASRAPRAPVMDASVTAPPLSQGDHHLGRSGLCVCRRCPLVRPGHLHHGEARPWHLLWDAGMPVGRTEAGKPRPGARGWPSGLFNPAFQMVSPKAKLVEQSGGAFVGFSYICLLLRDVLIHTSAGRSRLLCPLKRFIYLSVYLCVYQGQYTWMHIAVNVPLLALKSYFPPVVSGQDVKCCDLRAALRLCCR